MQPVLSFDKKKKKNNELKLLSSILSKHSSTIQNEVDAEQPISLIDMASSANPTQQPVAAKDDDTGKDAYRNAVANKKVALNDYLFSAPKQPEFDESRQKDYKNLSKIAMLGQLFDATTDIVSRKTMGRNAVTNPANFDQLGMSALAGLQNMDSEYRTKLENYERELRGVQDKNTAMKMNADAHNRNVDVELAKFEYETAIKDETKAQLKQDKTKEMNYQAGLRFVSQGDLDSGFKFLQLAGLGSDEIEALVGKYQKGGGRSGAGGRGGGTGKGETGLTIFEENALRRYQQLQKLVTDADYGVDVSTGDTVAKSANAKEMESIKKDLGIKIYTPLGDEPSEKVDPKVEVPVTAGDLSKKFSPEQLKAGLGGEVAELNQVDLSTDQGQAELWTYAEHMGIAIANATEETERVALLDRFVTDLIQKAGFSEEEAFEAVRQSLGAEAKPKDEATTITDPSTGSAVATKGKGDSSTSTIKEKPKDKALEKYPLTNAELKLDRLEELRSKGANITEDEFKEMRYLRGKEATYKIDAKVAEKNRAKIYNPQRDSLAQENRKKWRNRWGKFIDMIDGESYEEFIKRQGN